MTKLEKLKSDIGFTKVNKQCQNCKHFASDKTRGGWHNALVETNLRCSKYGFKVNKTTTCDEHEK